MTQDFGDDVELLEFDNMGDGNRFFIAEQALGRMLWAEPELWQRMAGSASLQAVLRRAREFRAPDIVADISQGPLAGPYAAAFLQTMAAAIGNEHGMRISLAATSLAWGLVPDYAAIATLYYMSDDLAVKLIEADLSTALSDWRIHPPKLVVPMEILLTLCLAEALGRSLPFPARTLVPGLHSDPEDKLTFEFTPPQTASPEDFDAAIGDQLKAARRQITDKYLAAVKGRRVVKLMETIERNVLLLYEHGVRGRSLRSLAAEHFGSNDRHKDVREGIRRAATDLKLDGWGDF